MTDREALISLNKIIGLGAMTVKKMVAQFGSLPAIFTASEHDISAIQGIGRDKSRCFYEQLKQTTADDQLERAERSNVKLVTWVDAEYPPLLKEIADAPMVLYVAGSVASLSLPCVAIVGTRHPTIYGRETARKFGYQLAGAGYTVVSGLALGIDAEAHLGALQAQGSTVAVLGGAIDCLFPKENQKLAHDISLSNGAVISEYPFGRQPDRQTFPMRNRIVSGLSKGVLVIEAPLSSGTLITVEQALDQNRTVMAVPGRLDSPVSQGCHKLIREGARLVTSFDDVLEEIQNLFACAARPLRLSESSPETANTTKNAECILSPEERKIMLLIEPTGSAIDTIIRESGIDAGKVNALLIGLQIRRVIKLMPGNMVARRSK